MKELYLICSLQKVSCKFKDLTLYIYCIYSLGRSTFTHGLYAKNANSEIVLCVQNGNVGTKCLIFGVTDFLPLGKKDTRCK